MKKQKTFNEWKYNNENEDRFKLKFIYWYLWNTNPKNHEHRIFFFTEVVVVYFFELQYNNNIYVKIEILWHDYVKENWQLQRKSFDENQNKTLFCIEKWFIKFKMLVSGTTKIKLFWSEKKENQKQNERGKQ